MNYKKLLEAVTKALDYTKQQEPSVRMEAELSALRAIVELHKPDNYGECFGCDSEYPCKTIQRIAEQLS